MNLKTELTKWACGEFSPVLNRDSFNLSERTTIKESALIQEIEMTIQRKLPADQPVSADLIEIWKTVLQEISMNTMIDFHVGDELIAQSKPGGEMAKGRSVLIQAKFYYKTRG